MSVINSKPYDVAVVRGRRSATGRKGQQVDVDEWTFGTYQVGARIGRGGMGEVYRAYDRRSDRTVALKLLSPYLSLDAGYRTRFCHETHVAARLREPHLIPIHDAGEFEGRLFVDMRLVDGRNLATALAQDGAMPARRAVDIIGQVARAVDAAHAGGLVHRGIKPSNIILAAEETDESTDFDFVFAYLTDFGIARGAGDDGDAEAPTGVIGALTALDYEPPERFAGAPADRRADVYSLACVLFECLTGRRPAGDVGPLGLSRELRTDWAGAPPASVPPAVAEALQAVLARGMAENPVDRFATAGTLASAARIALRAKASVPVPQPQTQAAPVESERPRAASRRAASRSRGGKHGQDALTMVAAVILVIMLLATAVVVFAREGTSPAGTSSGSENSLRGANRSSTALLSTF